MELHDFLETALLVQGFPFVRTAGGTEFIVLKGLAPFLIALAAFRGGADLPWLWGFWSVNFIYHGDIGPHFCLVTLLPILS